MKKHLEVIIYGRVQGVFFREMAMAEAVKLNLTGYADRLEDGTVIIEVEGSEDNLQRFLRWCRRGPVLAKVEMLTFEYSVQVRNFEIFEIRKSYTSIRQSSVHGQRFY